MTTMAIKICSKITPLAGFLSCLAIIQLKTASKTKPAMMLEIMAKSSRNSNTGIKNKPANLDR